TGVQTCALPISDDGHRAQLRRFAAAGAERFGHGGRVACGDRHSVPAGQGGPGCARLCGGTPPGAPMPIRSMTAFASAEQGGPDGTLACELRAVNHRFLEIGLRLPEELRALEPALRERIAARIGRGKLELGMRLRGAEGAEALQLDPGVVGQLSRLAQELHARFPMLRVELTDLLQYPGLLAGRGVDMERLQARAMALLEQVLDAFVAAREREGGKLAEVILERVDAISRIVGDVRGMVPAIRAGQARRRGARPADLPQE